jgi:hypothetical protein
LAWPRGPDAITESAVAGRRIALARYHLWVVWLSQAAAAVTMDSRAGSSGGMFYQPGKPDWSLDPTSRGFLSLHGVSESGKFGQSTFVASPAMRWPLAILLGLHVQRVKCAPVLPVCRSGCRSKTMFLRREDGRLQRDCLGRRRRGPPGEACKDVIVIFMFVKGVFVSVGM